MPASADRVRDSVAKVDHEVAVGEDLGFQRKWWRFERAVWIVFVILIGLDVLGVFGRGPVAHAEIKSPDGSLDVRYERIERTGTPSILAVECGPATVHGGKVGLFVSDSVVGGLGAQRIVPQPAETRLGGGGLTYLFPVERPPAVVRFALQPSAAGVYPFEVRIPGGPALHARILVVP